VTSSTRSPFGSPRPHSYRLPIVTYPLAPLVSEIFDLKVADKQNSTLSDNKGPLKLSAREPTHKTLKLRHGVLKSVKCIIITLMSLVAEDSNRAPTNIISKKLATVH